MNESAFSYFQPHPQHHPHPQSASRDRNCLSCLFLSQKSQYQLKGFQRLNFHFISQSKKQVLRPFPKAAMKVKTGQIQRQKQTQRQLSPHSLDIWKVCPFPASLSHSLHPLAAVWARTSQLYRGCHQSLLEMTPKPSGSHVHHRSALTYFLAWGKTLTTAVTRLKFLELIKETNFMTAALQMFPQTFIICKIVVS